MIETVKKHPVLLGSVAVGALLLFMVMSGGSSPVSAGTVGSDVSAGNELQAAQLAAQTQLAQGSMALQANSDNNAAAIELANINANSTNAANTMAAQIAALQITRGADSTDLANTLQADVINKQTQSQVDMASIQSNTTIQTINAMTNALVQQSQPKDCGFLGLWKC